LFLTCIPAFGTKKAVTNFFAGTWSDRYGRKNRSSSPDG
jgi:MFS family permease